MPQVGQELDEDPRLRVLKKEWFEGKDCLDVGCNNGLVAIHIGEWIVHSPHGFIVPLCLSESQLKVCCFTRLCFVSDDS